ncbi:enoyl-CoA hydratase [Sphingobium sp. 3R8]|uniref:enoyl-CoA hydratase n=1 Tax=Sphingobium sp. 3R8 TaxID=2874921 RepID=UPI001CCA9EEC|nr:enoyl-CoA hydratase [Sphingobium sp. 3R8]MBZ9646885.1 enoyl-CoA hydratase [Sphingobium sp. 3R8]
MAADHRKDWGAGAEAAQPQLRIDRPQAGLAIVTLNRPAVMNALSWDLRILLIDAFGTLQRDGVRVVVLTGAGRAFCAGLDLGEAATDSRALSSVSSHSPVAAIERFEGVVIGAVNGAAVTGGFELALACDILIASDYARFADTHVKVGAMPGWGLSQKLSRAIGPYRAKQMSLTGRYVSAAQAADWGLVAEVVAPGQLLAVATGLAQHLLAQPADVLRSYTRLIDDGYAVTLSDGLAMEAERATTHNEAVDPVSIDARRASVQAHGKAGLQDSP